MTGKSREIVDMMRRRNIGIACIQEARWKGSKAREIGDGYKMYYHGEKTSRNGIVIQCSAQVFKRAGCHLKSAL